jgi:aspartyl-tRNA(Asn)/glutamyl-tRNA(Gln) amidotransferase subunit A
VKQLTSPVSFAQIAGWHKAIIEYEVAHAHPHLEHNPDVSAGLREAVARGRLVGDRAYLDAIAALSTARERFWLEPAQVDALLFPAAPDVAPVGMQTGDPRFIVPFTALGGPIVSIPVGTGAGGMPLGLMLIGAPGTDAEISVIAERIAPVIELPR